MHVRANAFCVLAIVLTFVCEKSLWGEKPIKLYKEETTIAIEEHALSVNGFYFFENRTDFELDVSISYPFPVSNQQLFPEPVAVLDPEDPIEHEKRGKGIRWSHHFEPASIETVLVKFSQALKAKRATYLLRRGLWDGKVDKISMVVTLPSSFENVTLSIEPDSLGSDEQTQNFFITRHYFEPEQDLLITWE